MRSRVLVDVSLLADGTLPTDESWWLDRANSSFELVFPETLAAFLRGETDHAANLLGELIIAYKKKAANTPEQADSDTKAAEDELRTSVLAIANQYGRAFGRLAAKGLIEEYTVADGSPEAAWLQRLIDDEDLRDYIRNAYVTHLGLPRDALLDHYYFELLAGMTVDGAPSADPYLLASSDATTLQVLSDAVGPPAVEVNALLPQAHDRQLQHLQKFQHTQGQLAAELAPQSTASNSPAQANKLALSAFVGRSPADLLAGAPVARGVFLTASGAEPLDPSASQRPPIDWRTIGLALAGLLMVVAGAIILRYSGLFPGTAIPAPTPGPDLEDTITPTADPGAKGDHPTETATPEAPPTSGAPGAVAPVVIYVTVIGDAVQEASGGDSHWRQPYMDHPYPAGGFGPRQPALYPVDYRRPYPDMAPNPRAYIVQPGDTVFGLARRFGVSPQAIVQANNLPNPNYIRVGQVLVVP